MKAICVEIINPVTDEVQSDNNWLTVNKTYVVISMTISGRAIEARILSDDNALPIIVDWSQFRLISGRMPSNWRLRIDAYGNVDLAPDSWLRAGFWQDFFDGIQSAVESFQSELQLILSESSD